MNGKKRIRKQRTLTLYWQWLAGDIINVSELRLIQEI